MKSKTIFYIGCHEHTLPYWEKHYKAITRANQASEALTAEYKLYIDLAAKLYPPTKNKP